MIISTSGRSSSKRRYEQLLKDLNIEGQVKYETFDVTGEGDAAAFAAMLRRRDTNKMCIGGAISKGIKASIIKELDSLDATAEVQQSVNTVVVSPIDGSLKGYNSDMLGFRIAIAGSMPTDEPFKSAIIYGYGGVTLVASRVLMSLGMDASSIFITGRDQSKARARAAELGVRAWADITEEARAREGVDLFVNATPVTDRDLSLAANFLPALEATRRAVFDHEMPGQKLKDWLDGTNRNSNSSSNGGRQLVYISGLDMYRPQCVEQWALFLAEYASKEEVAAALNTLFAQEDAEENR
jgi:shikimate 5-dehydrogenase